MVNPVNRTGGSITSRLFSFVDENFLGKGRESSSVISFVIKNLSRVIRDHSKPEFESILKANTLEERASLVHSLTIEHRSENPECMDRIRSCIPVSLLNRSTRVADRIAVQTLHGKAPNRLQVLIIRVREIVNEVIFSVFGLSKNRRAAILQRMVRAVEIIRGLKEGSTDVRLSILKNQDRMQIIKKFEEDLRILSRFVDKNKKASSSPTYENLSFVAKDVHHCIREIRFALARAEIQECLYKKVSQEGIIGKPNERLKTMYPVFNEQILALAQLAVISRKEMRAPSEPYELGLSPICRQHISENTTALFRAVINKNYSTLSRTNKKTLYRITKEDVRLHRFLQNKEIAAVPNFDKRKPTFSQKCINKICEFAKKIFFLNSQESPAVPVVEKNEFQTITRSLSFDKMNSSYGDNTCFDIVRRLKKDFSVVEHRIETTEGNLAIVDYDLLLLIGRLRKDIDKIQEAFEVEVKERFYFQFLQQHLAPSILACKNDLQQIAQIYPSSKKMHLFVIAQLSMIARKEQDIEQDIREKERKANFATYMMVFLNQMVREQKKDLSKEDNEILYEITQGVFVFIPSPYANK